MGGSPSKAQPVLNIRGQTTVPVGKVRICIALSPICQYASHSRRIAHHIVSTYGSMYENWYFVDTRFEKFIIDTFEHIPFPEHLKGHSTSPFVWLEVADTDGSGKTSKMAIAGGNRVSALIGGDTDFCAWVQANTGPGKLFPSSDAALAALVGRSTSVFQDGFSNDDVPTAAPFIKV